MPTLTETPVLEEVTEQRIEWAASRPVTFDEYLAFPNENNDILELIGGVVQKRMAAQLDREKLFAFLIRLLGDYAEEQDLGLVLGSRTPVQVGVFGGRLPDLVFVRRENLTQIDQRAIRSAPDLVIEIVSPNDRPFQLVALEADYRTIGVREIVFIDQGRGTIRVVRQQAGTGTENYAEETTGPGDTLTLHTLDHVSLPASWLLLEPRPAVRVALSQIITASDAA